MWSWALDIVSIIIILLKKSWLTCELYVAVDIDKGYIISQGGLVESRVQAKGTGLDYQLRVWHSYCPKTDPDETRPDGMRKIKLTLHI